MGGEHQSLSAVRIFVPGAGPRRQSLPGPGRGDRAQRGGRGPSVAERGEDRIQHPLQVPVHLAVPEPQDAKPIGAHRVVADRVAHGAAVETMGFPIHLNREVVPETDEIDDVATMRALATEVVSERSPISQSIPQLHFLWRHRLSQTSCALVVHDACSLRTPPTALRAVPPPRAGEGLVSALTVCAERRGVETEAC